MAAPAQLPLFRELRNALLDALDVGDDVAAVASQLAPETFMRALNDGGLALSAWLTAALSSTEPNALHHVLAEAWRRGDTIWTVNIDELIEIALGGAAEVAAYPDEVPAPSARILKPHGTVSLGDYVFRSDQVINPLPKRWAERLAMDLDGAEVVLIGYAGADIDLRMTLGEALENAASVTWYMTRSDAAVAVERFPALSRIPCRFVGNDDPVELTRIFIEDARASGLMIGVDPRMLSQISERPEPVVPEILGPVVLARALLEERCGFRNAARADLRRSLVSPRLMGHWKLAVSTLLRLGLYEPTRWARFGFWLSDGWRGAWMPKSARRKLQRVEVTLLSSHEGRHAEAVACRPVDRPRRSGDGHRSGESRSVPWRHC